MFIERLGTFRRVRVFLLLLIWDIIGKINISKAPRKNGYNKSSCEQFVFGGAGLPHCLDQVHHGHKQYEASNTKNEDVKPWDNHMDFDTMESLQPIVEADGSSADDYEDDAQVGLDVLNRSIIEPGAASSRL